MSIGPHASKERVAVKKEFKKALIFLRAFYTNKRDIPKIFLACDLRPISGWRRWRSPFGRILKVRDVNEVIITTGHEYKIRDLYHYASIKKIAEVSKKIYLTSFGHFYCLLFLGHDEKLRAFKLVKGKWYRTCALSLGLKKLRTFYKYENVEWDKGGKLIFELPPSTKNYKRIDKWLNTNIKTSFLELFGTLSETPHCLAAVVTDY